MRKLVKAIASVGFLGYIPFISGTVTSFIFALLIYKFVISFGWYCFLAVFFIALGFMFCGRAANIYNRGDPKQVVIDEVAGLFVALFLIPYEIKPFLIAFVLFRFFDILKPPPISTVEKIKGSAGIMLDDLLAGLFANIITQLLLRFIL